MTGNEYQKLAERTMDFKNLTPAELEMHALHGMVGEIGELHSIYQKVYQGHHFDDVHAMKEVGDKIDAADRSAVEADVQTLKDLLAKAGDEMTDAQVAEIKAAKEKLMESAQKLFTKVYEQAGAAAGAAGAQGGPAPEAGPAPEGYSGADVVDGDYREV